MSGLLRKCRLAVAAAVVSWGGGANAQSPLPQAVAPGANLEVYVMTMGPGDMIWERFGHNAIGIRDRDAGTDIVYNWGPHSGAPPRRWSKTPHRFHRRAPSTHQQSGRDRMN